MFPASARGAVRATGGRRERAGRSSYFGVGLPSLLVLSLTPTGAQFAYTATVPQFMRRHACILCNDRQIPKQHKIDLTAIDPETADFIAGAMDGLATGTRIQLLCRLAQGPRSVKQLTAETDMEQPAVSQQLRVLRDLGFVRAQKQGRKKIYELHDSHVIGLLEQAIAHSEHLQGHLTSTG